VGFIVFFCLSVDSINKEIGFWFRLGEVELRFKEFLASPAMMHFQVLRSFLLLPQ
jgi:hypothetical protein